MTTSDDGHDVRDLLHDAVDDVEPAYGLDAIRRRTAAPRRRWVWPAVGVAAAAAAVIAGTTLAGQGPSPSPAPAPAPAGRSTAADDGPSTAATTPSSEPSGAGGSAIAVYYVGDTSHGPRLFREFHRVTTGDPALTAARLAVEGTPDDPDYRSVWPAGTRVEGVSFDGIGDAGGVQIRLSGTDLEKLPLGMTDREAALALQGVIWSVDAVMQARPAYVWYLDGTRAETTLGQGVAPSGRALSPDDVLAQVQVDDPADGSTVGSTFTVRGRAAAFEANVQWELAQGSTVVKRGFTTAQECCTLSPYSFRVHGVAPGDYTLVVHDEDASGGEGGPPWQDTKQITVE